MPVQVVAQGSDTAVVPQPPEVAQCCALLSEVQPVLEEILGYEEQLNEVKSLRER